MVRVADWSFLGVGTLEAAMMMLGAVRCTDRLSAAINGLHQRQSPITRTPANPTLQQSTWPPISSTTSSTVEAGTAYAPGNIT